MMGNVQPEQDKPEGTTSNLGWGRGWRVIFRREESKHFEHRGHFSMAAGILPAASPKKDDYEYTKATESS